MHALKKLSAQAWRKKADRYIKLAARALDASEFTTAHFWLTLADVALGAFNACTDVSEEIVASLRKELNKSVVLPDEITKLVDNLLPIPVEE
jgi:hypothetical protein